MLHPFNQGFVFGVVWWSGWDTVFKICLTKDLLPLLVSSALLWAGNDNIHLLTSRERQRVRFDFHDWEGHSAYAEYDAFEVGSEQTKYTLKSVGKYSGTAGQLQFHLTQITLGRYIISYHIISYHIISYRSP